MNTDEKAIKKKLQFLYGEKIAEKTREKLNKLISKYEKIIPRKSFDFNEKDVVLITYGDSFLKSGEKPLRVLGEFLNTYLSDTITIVHILPFFPYSSDDGFSVIDYLEVNPALGGWDEVDSLGQNFHLMFDAVINHISAKSKEFREFLKNSPANRDYFIVVEPGMDISRVFRPRTLPLTTEFETKRGLLNLWTTFSTDQIDLNFSNPDVLLFIIEVLLFYAAHGASMIRLDAIAFLWKESGTSCLHLPQTHEVIKLFRSIFDLTAPHVKIITETNVPHKENISYFGSGNDEAHMIYNFALPPLTVDALLTGDARILSGWARSLKLPGKNTFFYNFTASHDGIGLLPAHNILSRNQIQNLVSAAENRGGRVGYKNNPDGTKTAYELNISLFDLLSDPGSDEPPAIKVSRFIASQAIALSMAGVPAIYYHSMVGSRNYLEGVEKTGVNRSINREKLKLPAMVKELETPGTIRNFVFNRLSLLIGERRKHRAFHPGGKQNVLQLNPRIFAVERHSSGGDEMILSLINVSEERVTLSLEHPYKKDVLTGKTFSKEISMAPYEVLWLQ